MSTQHKSVQRFYIQGGKGELYGTNALKGFTERGVGFKLALLRKLHPRRKFNVVEVVSFKELTDGLETETID